MFIELGERELTPLLTGDSKTLLITSFNYEDRCLAVVKAVRRFCKEDTNLVWRSAILKGKFFHTGILEELKQRKIEEAEKELASCDYNTTTIPYPDGYSEVAISGRIEDWITEGGGEFQNIIIDISAFPRALVLDVSKAFESITKRMPSLNLVVAYTTAKDYTLLRYPSNPGRLEGYFRKGTLSATISNSQNLIAAIFPGIQGFEGKLLYDELAAKDGAKNSFIFMGRDDLLKALATMRANMALLQHTVADNKYYFSIQDGSRKLIDFFKEEVTRLKDLNPTVLIAPFGPKPFAWTAYMLCSHIRNDLDFKSEIVLMSGVQYTSVYSVGIGTTTFLKYIPFSIIE